MIFQGFFGSDCDLPLKPVLANFFLYEIGVLL